MKANKGLTLIELMVTLAVAIILLGFGVPLFRTMIANNALITQTNGVVTALNLARSEAVKRGTDVALCAKGSADVATTACGADWTNGWHMFTDGGTAGSVDGDDEVLRHWEPLVDAAGVVGSAGVIRFSSEGAAGTAERRFEISYEGARAEDRCVRVAASGAIRTHKVIDGQPCE